jgi:neopullulanase
MQITSASFALRTNMKEKQAMRLKLSLALSLAAAPLWLTSPAMAQPVVPIEQVRNRLPEDEVIYFVLPDRFANGDVKNDTGGINGDRMKHGFDPTHKGFYQGGDLKGLTQKLDYIQGMGVTAIWFAPIFKNKAVQGGPGQESAGYHGYWITDFTAVDPHLGTNAEFKAFVDAAHARGMKVYMDIVVNHTADVIQYRDCPGDCAYRNIADYPYSRRGGVKGAPINPGFLGDSVQTDENFARLTDMNFAYQPFVPKGEENVKVPAWLNDIRYYHNRGNSYWKGESVVYGDFVGLDDIAAENPRVISGFIDVFGKWIDDFGVDGFRIDTSKHVNSEFWHAFIPAMQERAKLRGIPNFHIFAEVMVDGTDTATLARYNRTDQYHTLDFAFTGAVIEALSGNNGPEALSRLTANDILYRDGPSSAKRMPTFLSNHDIARFSTNLRRRMPDIGQEELLKRVQLGHALMFTMRGVPTIYSGDEQGFVGDGGDQDARETHFASQVKVYQDNRLIGTANTHAQDNYAQDHPIYRHIAALSKIRSGSTALQRGKTVARNHGEKPGLFAFSRIDETSGEEVMVVANTSDQPIASNFELSPSATSFSSIHGTCPVLNAPGSASVSLQPFEYVICAVK